MDLTPHLLLFVLAAIGISESSYLIHKRRAAQAPVCPIGTGCTTVLYSRYNRLFLGIHNDVAGLLIYIALTGLTALLVVMDRPPLWAPMAIFILLGMATAVSLALVYLQWRVIRAWCFWCLMTAATVALMDIIVLTAQLGVAQ